MPKSMEELINEYRVRCVHGKKTGIGREEFQQEICQVILEGLPKEKVYKEKLKT